MPIELQFTRDGLGVIYQCEGSLGLQHFADANSRLLASPERIKKLKYAIVDGASVEPQYFSVTRMEGIILRDRHIASYAVEGLLVALVAEQSMDPAEPGEDQPAAAELQRCIAASRSCRA